MLLFPPIINEIKAYPENLQDLYTYLREAWGHFAQGPAGIISRFGDEAVFCVDSLGFVHFGFLKRKDPICSLLNQESFLRVNMLDDPKPLAPGEKVGFKWNGESY